MILDTWGSREIWFPWYRHNNFTKPTETEKKTSSVEPVKNICFDNWLCFPVYSVHNLLNLEWNEYVLQKYSVEMLPFVLGKSILNTTCAEKRAFEVFFIDQQALIAYISLPFLSRLCRKEIGYSVVCLILSSEKMPKDILRRKKQTNMSPLPKFLGQGLIPPPAWSLELVLFSLFCSWEHQLYLSRDNDVKLKVLLDS